MTNATPADSAHSRRAARDDRIAKPIGPRRCAARPSGRPVLVCAGDSITHGAMSANWVSQVASSAASVADTVNAGVNGNLAWNLLSRLDEIIACRPSVVTVLIGTNDALAHISDAWSDGYMKGQRLPQRPTAQWYEANLQRIVERLQSETSAAIALMSLPPLGDEAEGRWHDLIAPYNAIIHAVAARAGVPVLPVHEDVSELITHRPPVPWDGTKKLMGRAVVRRFLLRRSWDVIARQHGFSTTTDAVHLNERAGARIAALVEQFARSGKKSRGRHAPLSTARAGTVRADQASARSSNPEADWVRARRSSTDPLDEVVEVSEVARRAL
jgi:acyl-CoA thioesterase I